ncbi:MAG: hypothetical protein MK538_02210 [Planctomycetes bacterium]|nr:hypothetical protein [Planctomycetota bacterium]
MKRLESMGDFEQFLAQFTNYERLGSYRYDKSTLGLDRIADLLRDMGNPETAYPIVHIAGSKGKGSTSLILEALLLARGKRVGLYTSPHVEHLTERIRECGRAISIAELLSTTNDQLPLLRSRRENAPDRFPSFFELMTALAFESFRRWSVDWAVVEVGLGGRLDATNVTQPALTVITSIGLEHTAQLGNSLRAIAAEKAGIVKTATPLILGPLPAEADEEILRTANELGAPVIRARPEVVQVVGRDELLLTDLGLRVQAGSIRGPAMRTDLAIALAAFQAIHETEGTDQDLDALSAGLRSLEMPARVEIFPGNPPIVVDGAHTIDSVRALKHALEESEFPLARTVLCSISHGKELEALLAELDGVAERFIFTRADDLRSIPPEELRIRFGRGLVCDSPEEALADALQQGDPVVVTGSFYLAGRLRPLIRRRTHDAVPSGN